MRFLTSLIVRWLWPEIERRMDERLSIDLRAAEWVITHDDRPTWDAQSISE